MNRELNLNPEQEAAVGRFLAGEMSAAERVAFEREVVRSDDLAEGLYRQREIADWLASRSEPSRLPLRRPRVQWSLAGLLAAAAVASFFMVVHPGLDKMGLDGPDSAPVFRGEQSATPSPVGGEGVLAAWPGALVWRAVPGAVRYRVQLRDDQAVSLLIAVTADTMLSLNREQMPRELPHGGHWQVTPIYSGDREGPAGPVVRFEVRN